jgi:toxin ParE1/3/4
MAGYTLTQGARRDLDSITAHSVREWGREQAVHYAQDLRSAIEMIAANPLRGRSRDEIRKGYFSVPRGSHIIFYRRTSDGVEVVRILHQRMEPGRHL